MEFQILRGMGEPIGREALTKMGYPVRVYTP